MKVNVGFSENNGAFDAKFSSLQVAVSGVVINNQDKTITENGTYTADDGFTGLGVVNVDVPSKLPSIEPLTVTENGTYTAPDGVDGYSPITVDVASSGTDERFKQLVEGTLTEIEDNEITNIAKYSFYDKYSLAKAVFPNVTRVWQGAFERSAIQEISLPKVTSIGSTNCFAYCVKLTKVYLPLVGTIFSNCFSGCYWLKVLDLPSLTNISGTYSIANCHSLTALILRGDSLCSLANTNCLSGYHFSGKVSATYNPEGLKDGYIYVPSALIEQYKVATNWVTFADQFRALEDYTVDGTTTGELDESKVNA